ncbi:unnamed protein product [Aphanomyces euteiches]|uniref:Uncharacterized protein n=1 Tax=Aphanomyces euteiches TaxID=100861 RepID=A0A6G0XH74_9STRA|nr:hypothetical protein Ae201684_004756 [Aphanomyces euteiches]KAH9073251.1 hypothetical protein Ae201684P_015068 [Aphanomyces euteiches]KAH9139761.1 hypothetical protein AeRB84_015982 [Aphanomyces euteiches]
MSSFVLSNSDHDEESFATDEDRRQQHEPNDRIAWIQLEIFYLRGHKTIHISKHASLSKATERAAKLFDVPYDLNFVRLRSYDRYKTLPLETHTGREHCSLDQLGFDRYSSLLLEARSSPHDEWVEYDSSALQLLVRKYEPLPSPHFTEPATVLQIAEDSTVEDLVEILRMKYGLDRDKCRVLRMNGHGYWNLQTSVLNPADEDIYMQRILRQDLQLRNGCEVYVEECPSLDSSSVAKEFFVNQAHLMIICVECMDKNILARAKNPAMDNNEGAKWYFVVDRREPLQTLKDQLVKFLDMPPNSFRLLRGASEYAHELKHLNVSFMNLSMIDHTILFVSPGRPLAGDEFHIEIHWYRPKPRPKEPSNFLQGGVQPEELTLLMKFIVLNDVMVDKVRAAIAQHFAVKGFHAPYLRLQDYYHHRLNNILSDGFQLNQASKLTLVQDRRFAVQILAEPEVLPRDHMLFYMSVLDRANLKFGPLQEIIFECTNRQESWIDIFSHKVHEVTSIPVESMLFAKPHQSKSVNILEVDDFSWIDPEQVRQRLTAMSLGIYGDRIVVADGSVALKTLSKEERDGILLALVDNLSDVELQSTTAW